MAGANLNFFPLGTVARRTGIVHVRRATTTSRSTGWRCAPTSASWCPTGRTWSGRSRAAAPAPASCARRATACCATSSTRSRPRAPEPLLVPVSIVYDQLPLHEVALMAAEARGGASSPRTSAGWSSYARGLREPARAGPTSTSASRCRCASGWPSCAATAGGDACRRARRPGRLPPAQPGDPGDRHRGRVRRAAGRRPRADARRGAGHGRAAGRLSGPPRLAGRRRGEPHRPVDGAPDAAGTGPLRGAHRLRRRHRDGLGHRARPAPDRRLYRNSAIHVLLERAIAELALLAVARRRRVRAHRVG